MAACPTANFGCKPILAKHRVVQDAFGFQESTGGVAEVMSCTFMFGKDGATGMGVGPGLLGYLGLLLFFMIFILLVLYGFNYSFLHFYSASLS